MFLYGYPQPNLYLVFDVIWLFLGLSILITMCLAESNSDFTWISLPFITRLQPYLQLMNCSHLSVSLLSVLQTSQYERHLGLCQWVTNQGEEINEADEWGSPTLFGGQVGDGKWSFWGNERVNVEDRGFYALFTSPFSRSLLVYVCFGVPQAQFASSGQEKCFPHLVYPAECPSLCKRFNHRLYLVASNLSLTWKWDKLGTANGVYDMM